MRAVLLPLRVVLELCPHAGYRGFLTIDYGGNVQVQIRVRAHLAKLLLFLARTWNADSHASVRFRGLRTAKYIASRWKWLPDSSTISADAVRTYVKRIRKLVAAAVQAFAERIGRVLAVPELIIGELGYRLGRDRTEIVGADLEWPRGMGERECPSAGPSTDHAEIVFPEVMPDARAQLELQQGARVIHHEARGSAARASGAFYLFESHAAEPVRIPDGASVLSLELGRVRLRPVRAHSALRVPAAGTVLVETVAGQGLALVPGPDCDLRLNAEPAPRLAWARPGDELWLGSQSLRLVLHRVPYVGPPDTALLGRPCGLCQTPFSATTRIWACPTPGCEEVLHMEGQETPADARLECARLGDCPGCGKAVTTDPCWIGGGIGGEDGGPKVRRAEGEA